jgi:hypothetical protein
MSIIQTLIMDKEIISIVEDKCLSHNLISLIMNIVFSKILILLKNIQNNLKDNKINNRIISEIRLYILTKNV